MTPLRLTDFDDAALLARDLRHAAHLPAAHDPGSALLLIPTSLFTGHLPGGVPTGPGRVLAGLATRTGHVYVTQDGAAQQVTHDGRHYTLSPLSVHADPAPTDGYLVLLTPAAFRDLLRDLPPAPARSAVRQLLARLRPAPSDPLLAALPPIPVCPATPHRSGDTYGLTPLHPGAA